MRDPYKFLNVPYDVTESALKARFRDLAMKLHGDTGGSDEMMKLINEARDRIKFNIENGIRFSPEAEQAPVAEPEPAPRAKEQARRENRRSHEDSARASRDPPPNDSPESESGPNPGWGPGTNTWDVGRGTYASSAGTYSSRPYYSSRWKWWVGGGAALILFQMIASSGRHSPSSPENAPVANTNATTITVPYSVSNPPLPPESRPENHSPSPIGKFDIQDSNTVYTISPGDRYAITLPFGLVRVDTLSGQITLYTMNGELWRSCAARFTAQIVSSPAFRATACGQAPVVFHLVSVDPILRQEQHIVTTLQPGPTHPAVVFKSVPNGYSTSSPGVSVPMQ